MINIEIIEYNEPIELNINAVENIVNVTVEDVGIKGDDGTFPIISDLPPLP